MDIYPQRGLSLWYPRMDISTSTATLAETECVSFVIPLNTMLFFINKVHNSSKFTKFKRLSYCYHPQPVAYACLEMKFQHVAGSLLLDLDGIWKINAVLKILARIFQSSVISRIVKHFTCIKHCNHCSHIVDLYRDIDLFDMLSTNWDKQRKRTSRFYSRRNSLLFRRLYMPWSCPSVRPSVRLSVLRHIPVFCREEWSYDHGFSPTGRVIILVFGEVKIVWKFAGDNP